MCLFFKLIYISFRFWLNLISIQQIGHYFNLSRVDPELFHMKDLSQTSSSSYYYCYGAKPKGQVAHFFSLVNVAEDSCILSGHATSNRKQKRLTGQLLTFEQQRFHQAAKHVFGGDSIVANMHDHCFEFTTKFMFNSMLFFLHSARYT